MSSLCFCHLLQKSVEQREERAGNAQPRRAKLSVSPGVWSLEAAHRYCTCCWLSTLENPEPAAARARTGENRRPIWNPRGLKRLSTAAIIGTRDLGMCPVITYWSPGQAVFSIWWHDATDLVERDSSSRVVARVYDPGQVRQPVSWFSSRTGCAELSFGCVPWVHRISSLASICWSVNYAI